MGWFDLAVLILASFRLTHLVVFDTIAEPLRRAVKDLPFLGAMMECYWCAGVWVSLLLYAGYSLWPETLMPVAIIFAIAGGQALLERAATRE